MTDVLVSLTRDGETLSVVRESGGVRLAGNPVRPRSRALTQFSDGTWVAGGLLPDRADRATLRDVTGDEVAATCGRGAWIVPLSGPAVAMRFETADGQIVVIPGEGTGAAVPDALNDCPACDARVWESSAETVRCTNCGHQVDHWQLYAHHEPAEDREPVPAAEAEASARWARETARRLTLEELRGAPIYRADNSSEPPALGGFGGLPGQIDRAQVSHGQNLLIASDWTERHADARLALGTKVGLSGPWPDASPAAISIWLDAQERARDRAVVTAKPLTTVIDIDGQAVPASGLTAGPTWALTARTADTALTISGRGAVPERLVRIIDPVSELGRS